MSRRVTREWGRSPIRQTPVRGRRAQKPWRNITVVFLLVVGGFVLGRGFRSEPSAEPELAEATISELDVGGGANYDTRLEEVLPGSVISVPLDDAIVLDQEATQEANIAQDTAEISVETGAKDLVLTPVGGSQGSGTASSAYSADGFQHVIVATLPTPPEGYTYEGWLIRSTPFDFFSTGRLIQHADDLKWYLLWSSPEDFSDYGKVVVTLEPNDGDPAPSDHVLEGQF